MKEILKPLHILLVEDNPGDVRLIKEALNENGIMFKIHIASDGIEAIDFLRQRENFSNVSLPDLVLLDLNLPRKDGREILAEIKADRDLKKIPVIILTISNAEEDIRITYNHHANCYITKPSDLDDFIVVVKKIHEFWLKIVTLP